MQMNILILSAGTRNKVVQYFKKTVGNTGKVIATDMSELAPAVYEADKFYKVPRMTDPGYIDVIFDICRKEEIDAVGKKVKDLTGYEMKLFRPPYGAYNNEVIKTTYACNYYPIQWNVDSLDWKNYGVQSIIDTVCNHKDLGPGSIILCHNGAKYTAQALDELLTNLEEQGYTLVPISELIMTENYHMDVTGKQIAD